METFIWTHAWVLAPLIFCARVTDVSLGTCRQIIVVRGHRVLAAGIGFFESLIWLTAVSAVIAPRRLVPGARVWRGVRDRQLCRHLAGIEVGDRQ